MTSTIIVYGGCGALGRSVVKVFGKAGWKTVSIDLASNDAASDNVTVTANNPSLTKQADEILSGLQKSLDNGKVEAIACVAGGWAGGSPGDADFVTNAESIIQQSLWTSIIATQIAAKFLAPKGLLTLTGALAAQEATPGMMAYGLVKSSVHHLVGSLAASKSLPEGTHVNAILPVTLDTPANRKFMGGDTSSWTPVDDISSRLLSWAKGQEVPKAGALVSVVTKDGKTEFTTL